MKKLFVFICVLILTINVSSQSLVTWTDSIDISTMSRQDSVAQAPRYLSDYMPDVIDVAGMRYSVTVSSLNLDTSVNVSWGSTNKLIAGTNRYAFESVPSDSLPYRFYEPDRQTITNYDTTYQKNFISDDLFPGLRPQFKVDKDSAKSGYIIWDFLFY